MLHGQSIAIIGMGAIFPESNGLKSYWRLLFNGKDAITAIPEDSHWSLQDYFDENKATPDHTYCKRGGFIPKINFDPAKYSFPPNNLEATDTSQLLGLMVAEMALADAGYPPNGTNSINSNGLANSDISTTKLHKSVNVNPENRKIANHLRTSVILGVTGTQELVIPLGARLYHPLWKKALQESGITGEKHDEIIERISASFPKWQENSFPGLLGNVVAGRIANRLNLGGTNTVIDAACASSLSAIHTACLELLSERCDLSVSGGVDCLNDIFMHICFSKTGVLSHTSDAKPFSKEADGTVLGEGIGMVVLKRLEDAERDNDKIYAVIKGIGTSSDGKTGGIYAPDAGGQLRALKSAYSQAKVDPSTVELFEAHGTGTRVGDKIEITALKSLFNPTPAPLPNGDGDKNDFLPNGDGDKKNSLPLGRDGEGQEGLNKNTVAVGSVKSMIGHAKAAAGAAGLIKAVLSLHHKVIPPTLKAENPDPEIDIINSPFYLNPIAKPWVKSDNHPRRCGVSAFGFGGSNFHVVLEEYRQNKEHVSWDGTVQIAAFSANTLEKLKENILKFKDSINALDSGKSSAGVTLDCSEKAHNIAWECQNLRKNFSSSDLHRLLIVITDQDDPETKATEALEYLVDSANKTKNLSENKTGIFYGSDFISPPISLDKRREEKRELNPKIGFLFPGQGSQYIGMGRELISMFPEALLALESAQDMFEKINNNQKGKLQDYIFPPPLYAQDEKTSEDKLRSTDIAQPAIGAVSLAMAKILARFGIKPDAVCGHSFGELTALCVANWIDDETFFKLASERGKLMANAALEGDDAAGTMFAVKASLNEIEELIKSENLDLVVANINSPNQVVLSGRTDEINRAAKICKAQKLRGVKLTVAAAFHSKLVENAVAPFKEIVDKININFSNNADNIIVNAVNADASDKVNVDNSEKENVDSTHKKIDKKIAVFSNTTGEKYPNDLDKIKVLLGEQIINPVHFMKNIESMLDNNITTFIEVGPKSILTGLTRSILENKGQSISKDSAVSKNSKLESENFKKFLDKNIISLSMDSSAGKKRAIEDLAYLLCSLAASGFEVSLDQWEDTVEEPAKKAMRIPLTGANVKPKLQENVKSKRQEDVKPKSQEDVKSKLQEEIKPKLQATIKNHEKLLAPTLSPNSSTLLHNSSSLHIIKEPQQIYIKKSNSKQEKGVDMDRKYNPVESRSIASHVSDTQPSSINHQPSTTNHQASANYQQLLTHQSPIIYSAMQMVQKGMESMQELQTRTALAHEKFLETQAAASRTLQAMMEQTRFFAENAIYSLNNNNSHNQTKIYENNTPQIKIETSNIPPKNNGKNNTAVNLHYQPTTTVHQQAQANNAHKTDHVKIESSNYVQTKPSSYIQPQKVEHVQPKTADYVQAKPVDYTQTKPEVQSETTLEPSSVVKVESILLETVSKLTGFPVEMLTLDMDIESDLGIDSIKRVEIVSELEKSLPNADALTPENMGTLKTLKDICDALTPATQTVQTINQYIPNHYQPSHSNHQTASQQQHINSQEHIVLQKYVDSQEHITSQAQVDSNSQNTNQNTMEILMETISELTGFPAEMLTSDMDIESDLGIDSIKRVEILSKLEEKLPEAKQISPDDLGRLKTIEQIAKHISGDQKEKAEIKETETAGIESSSYQRASSQVEPCQITSCQKKNS